MKILLTGGGTAGSATPLIAIAEKLKGHDILFIGTEDGPEREVVEAAGIKFQSFIAGKFRRYISFRTPIDGFKVLIAIVKAYFFLGRVKPDVIVSAGSFVSPPFIWAGKFRGIKSLVHHQDLQMTMATKLMKKNATVLTKAFKEIPLEAIWTGNPVRDLSPTTSEINFQDDKPVVLIMGGGIGAQKVNELVNEKLLEFCNIIHITGKGKKGLELDSKNYQSFEFLTDQMNEALGKADIVVSRAGLGAISELSILGKPTILIPYEGAQEENARFLEEKNAAIVYGQDNLTQEKFTKKIKELIDNKEKQNSLSINIRKINKSDASQTIAEKIIKLA
ncbi:UDP-N-acetylglucosamine--N-acetylmuramyl-(pentapeptide) pyrophosphoryl-undecaprenol N-acetylglucosamine transferase [Patescibacteria group bacterium]|nr:UDP-N-acetylglucosamine--N-acetylmuramyl-(pentapeptide) pyrophosphoryl-undecaprenol N-acetylglucosamine transferase [Patescibacteria group bacterium]MBU1673722.1 UDP-N-acetylglucosamine--N-acetylmuramyl-(pentapeptide) pyrophosphoryl-undecaprenol N-acetylglucosamine transferase [Patescibacteria group bacterium]MBU1963048.1 UDP-N-acetylglucosamine--N-acetylmuramyl-(pentapeptide) pyrophosphoryl-undecaprenol N-acetylglucosamine transferase [Patescibacteria group bacterium]